jgi:two-component system, chemotaxis family, protein-glutamate methylesterase/glutaminase
MQEPTHPIIVIGGSAGSLDTLVLLLKELPATLPAAVFITLHMSGQPGSPGILSRLSKVAALPVDYAMDHAPIKSGHIYIAPADHHLLLNPDGMRLSKGPRENRFRPSIDPLFRSAAHHFTNRVIGVILSGMLDDGIEGLAAISRTNGIAVVQHPDDAMYPGMPKAAISRVKVDHIEPARNLGAVVAGLVFHPLKPSVPIPEDVLQEAMISERILTSLNFLEGIGKPTGYSCPSCGGVLWDVAHTPSVHSFRCHAGHVFGSETLYNEKGQQAEEAMWAALRLMEEQKRMLEQFSLHAVPAETVTARLAETQQYIDTIRSLLVQ